MLRNRVVLHVDDDPRITGIIAARLAKFGYEVLPVNNPLLVMDELARRQVRVVLLDIDMPQLSGLDLLKEIKAHDGGIQVIMLTGVVSITNLLQSIRFGAEACIFKPVQDIRPLADCIDDAFRKLDRWWQSLEELSQRRQREFAALSI